MSTKASELLTNSEVAESFDKAMESFPTMVSDLLKKFYAANPESIVFGDDGSFNTPLQVVVDVYKSCGSKSKTAKLFGKKPSSIRAKLIKAQAKGLVSGVMMESALSTQAQATLDGVSQGKSIKTIAGELEVKESSVRRHLITLQAKGLIKKQTVQAPAPFVLVS